MRLSFIGLGVMGAPMAGFLVGGGHDVTVFNRTTDRAERWVATHGGRHADTPAAAARDADIAFVCVGNDDDVRSVVYGDQGILATLPRGGILVDHTTASADLARELAAETAARGSHFLDAPVSGGQVGAETGRLTVMVGGEAGPFETARPVIELYARAVTLMGPAGSGQLTKMVNQICIAGLLQALSEGLNFARRAGLDGERVLDVISKGAAQSWQMENRGRSMLEGAFDFGFAVDWMRKDLAIAADEARRQGAQIPVTALVEQFYAAVSAHGGGRWDTSSLITLLQD